MSSKLGGTCGDACALEATHTGRCKCRLMLKIDAAVKPLSDADLTSLDAELKAKWSESKRNARTVVGGSRKGVPKKRKKVANG